MSDCNACLVGWEPDGYCEVFSRSVVKKSRKVFRCCECRRAIPIGSPYERTFTVFEGDAETYRTCMICVEIRDTYYCKPEGNPTLAMLWDDIDSEDFFINFTTGCLAKLKTPEAKAYMLERWQKWKGLK